MAGTAFRRARGFGRSVGYRWTIDLVSVVSACIVPFLIVDLGLAIQLLVSRNGSDLPQDWLLGPIVRGEFVRWPFFGDYERCLLALVVCGSVLAVLESVTVWALYRTVHKWALKTTTKIMSEIRAQVFRIGPNDLLSDKRSRPEELFSDTAEVLRQGLVHWRLAIPRAVVAVGVLLLLALAVNLWLTLLAVVLAYVIWRFYAQRRQQLQEEEHAWHKESRQRRDVLLETFRLAPLISGYALHETPGERFEVGLAQYESAALRAHMTQAFMRPLLVLTILFAIALFLLAVGLRQDTSIAGSAVLVSSLICAYFPAWRLYWLRETLQEAERSAAEIFAYLDREPSVGQIAEAKPLERLHQEVRLDSVTLADRSGKKLLDEIVISIPAGRRVAVLASDVHTPMALAGLFVRYYDPAAGRILFDGRDIRRATLDTVRGQSIFVSRDGPIFTGSVIDNIACGDAGFTTLQILEAAKYTGAHEFIQQLPQSLSTIIGEHDVRLRADQSFRIGLTRAILREPSLLVIEEPANDLDEVTATQIDAALAAISSGRTVIVLATRLATLRSADSVYVFHEGALSAHGKHADLLQSSELYRHLNYVRFNPYRNMSGRGER